MNTERIVFSNQTLQSFDFLKDNEADERAIARAVAFYTERLNSYKDNVLTLPYYDDNYWMKQVTQTQALLDLVDDMSVYGNLKALIPTASHYDSIDEFEKE